MIRINALALLMAPAVLCMASDFSLTLVGATATQIAFSYPIPSGGSYCTIKASTSYTAPDTWGAFPVDLDNTIFTNANVDTTRASTIVDTSTSTRTVVVGQRTAQLATAGTAGTYPYPGVRHYSRALQAATTYYFRVNCEGAGTLSSLLTQATTDIPLGQTYGDPWLSDPANPGVQPWPESIGGLTPESFIDPLTGTLQYRVGVRGNDPQIWNLQFGSAYNQGQTTPCDSAGPWTTPCGVVPGGSGGTTVANSTDVLVLRPVMSTNPPWDTNYGSTWALDQIGLSLTGSINSSNTCPGSTCYRNLNVCMSLNGGVSCASPTQQMTMSGSSSEVTLGDVPTNAFGTTYFGVDEWVLDTNPRLNAQESSAHSGTGTVSGNTVANNPAASGYAGSDLFSLYWVTGGNGHIRLSTNNDACISPPASTTSTEYEITGFVDGSHLTVAGTPPNGNVYWCEDNFVVMVWRAQAPTDGSTVTLTGAVLNVLGDASPEYPDNGAGTDCFNTEVYDGYFCLYGGLYWVDPVGPSAVYYGTPVAAGVDGSGTPITNSWTRVTAPIGESASIDQTHTDLTWYMVAYDPAGGGPLVIQGVFVPAAAPVQPTVPISGIGISQIENATVYDTAPNTPYPGYSLTWSATTPSPWTMTWTNLTPQSSVSETVADQMAAFDPTFNPTYFSTGPFGWNCGLTGAASQGIFFFACLSIGGDSPGWIFAFSPGVGSGYGNPACAGPTACGAWPANGSGPQIIGAMNTFNTPNGPVTLPNQGALTGRSLHGIAGAGESGWIAIDGNQYQPINSSATSIPSSSSACSTFSGLGSLGGQCIQIDINSYAARRLGSITSVSGTAPMGTSGQTCLLTGFNNGLISGAATVTLGTNNSWSGATIAVTNPGYGATAAPTSAADAPGGSAPAASCPTPVTVGTTITTATGYEPYFAAPYYPPFLGTPGELRTTQPGDTACVTAYPAGSCDYINGVNELMTLVQKNSGGQWVFQRGTKAAELAVSEPIELWWESYQSLMPPGGNNSSLADNVFWNPTAGCNGSPDPHGNCLIMDQNETNGHAEWQDGGYAAATNVPRWEETYYGWPTSYQTIVGSITTPCTYSNLCVLAYPYADNLPDPDTQANPYPPPTNFTWQTGVNYSNANPGFACYGSGLFSCTYGVPWGSDAGSHPNPAGANDPNNGGYAFDNTPVQGGGQDPSFTLVTGQLYEATPCLSSTCGLPTTGSETNGDNIYFDYGCIPCTAPIFRKVLATGASCGSHPLIDLSGPSSTITPDTTGPYTYCIARTAGECGCTSSVGGCTGVPTSSVGDVYVNCPGVLHTYCSGVATIGGTPLGVGNDICVGNIGVSGDAIRQFALAPAGGSDAPGAYTRNVATSTSWLRMVTGFENNRLLPGNSLDSPPWVLYRQEFLSYQRQDMWMAQLPSYPETDSYNRGEFIQETLSVPAHAGANNAVVEFGYQEYGVPTGYTKPEFMNCTTRNDPCWANAASIVSPPYSNTSPPFYYKSEFFITGGPSLLSCSGGCTIAIPAVSQRTLFYRVRYYNGNTHVANGATGVVEVP
jgi:hypothetical protein